MIEKQINSSGLPGMGKLNETYLNWTATQVNKLKDQLYLLEQQEARTSDTIVPEIFKLVHNIKGLGGSFGYYLTTDIAESLCEYVRYKTMTSEVSIDIIRGHIMALDTVHSEKITGSGGAAGEEILRHLRAMITESSPPPQA